MSNTNGSHDHWSDYWASGALTSLPEDFSGIYDGEVAAFWNAAFSRLSVSSRVLDVCTGNGPIALLAARYARENAADWRIDAVDAARSEPEVVAQRMGADAPLLERISFRGGTAIEALPFEDESFDLVTSQYGLEYADLDRAASELARVMASDGRLIFVHHAAESDMIKTMATEAQDYRTLADSGILKIIRSWGLGQLADTDLSRRLDGPLRRLQQQVQRTGGSPLLAQVTQSFGGLMQMPISVRREQKGSALAFASQLSSGQSRLEDMLRVNQKIANDPDWDAPFERTGLKRIDQGEIVYRGQHRMGGYQIWTR